MCKVPALYHVVTTSCYRCFWSNQRTGLDSGNQKELIASVSKLCVLNLSLDNIFWVTFFKSVFLGFSNRNTSLEFLKKKLSCYAVWHCRQPIPSPSSPTLLCPTSLPLSQHPMASPLSSHHTASHHRSPRPTSAPVKPSHELAPGDSVGLG